MNQAICVEAEEVHSVEHVRPDRYAEELGDVLRSFAPALAAQVAEEREFRELSIWIGEHLRDDLRIPALAARANMSERNFSRAFAREVGMSPGRFVERARYDAARSWLESSSENIDEIARRCGYRSDEVLRRAFLRQAGITPKHYRDRFALRRAVPRLKAS